MQQILPLTQDLVLIGGGHSHALVLRKWGMNPLPGVRVTVINPGPTAPYSGMLPGFVAGHYSRDDLDIDLVKLARFVGARLILGAANHIDPVARMITVPDHPPIAFDVAAVDIGITSEMPDLPGFAEHGIPAKPLGTFASRWDAFRDKARDDAHIAIIGGGVAGAELAMAMAHSLRVRGVSPTVHLIDRSRALAAIGDPARAKIRSAMASLGVTVVEQASVAEVSSDHVRLTDGRRIRSEFTTGAAGARAHDWIAGSGLDLENGYLRVSPTLQTSDPAIFATGDCAHMTASPRPKAGVFAVRQAPVLFDNLRAVLSGGALRRYRPQRDYLKLISLGEKSALAEKFGRAVSGPLLWRWKDQIDTKFMAQFATFAPMTRQPLPTPVALGVADALGPKPLCGGCGAKVGRGALQAALANLPAGQRSDVLSRPGDDAATLRMGGVTQVVTTDHLSMMVPDPVAMTRIAALHALGDIYAMGAAPQSATVNLILPRMSAALQARTLAEIMATAQAVFAEAGAEIIGGHTSHGSEMVIGFGLTGLCSAPPITLAGAKPGDALILTKPLGSGTVMAAEMAGTAKGADVAACLTLMQQGQGKAATILAGAHAMTDVTGFGIAGHLAGICSASGVAGVIDLDSVPLMQGALDLAQAGVRSTLFDDNRSGAGPVFGAHGPRGDLLFDPQTAGGLLAAVDATDAVSMIAALRAAGYTQAAVIGHVQAGDPAVQVQNADG